MNEFINKKHLFSKFLPQGVECEKERERHLGGNLFKSSEFIASSYFLY